MDIVLVLVVAVLLIAVVSRTFGSPGTLGFNAGNITSKKPKPKKAAPVARNPYRSTSIQVDDHACEAARNIAGKRFLDTDRNVPKVPLPECDASACHCKYAHHTDRRDSEEDQRQPSALRSELYEASGKPNRRQRKRGRRKSDWS